MFKHNIEAMFFNITLRKIPVGCFLCYLLNRSIINIDFRVKIL